MNISTKASSNFAHSLTNEKDSKSKNKKSHAVTYFKIKFIRHFYDSYIYNLYNNDIYYWNLTH